MSFNVHKLYATVAVLKDSEFLETGGETNGEAHGLDRGRFPSEACFMGRQDEIKSGTESGPVEAPAETIDLLIVGGGFSGLALAIAVERCGLKTVVVDRAAPRDVLGAGFDGRTCAFADASVRILEALDVWPDMAASAAPINDIRVCDGHSPLFLHYDHREVGHRPFGHVVENLVTRRALYRRLETCRHVTLEAPAGVDSLDFSDDGVTARLEDGRRLRAALAVAADGRRSQTRQSAGIRVGESAYNQTSIVCTIAHEHPHKGVAFERFYPAGPFAVLPMVDDASSSASWPHRSSIVWSEKSQLAPRLLALDDAEFTAELRRRLGDALGNLEVTGGRWSYPLGLLRAESLIGPRLALVGDAAHGIHPIAGQGLNLGLRDVATLAEVIVEARDQGRDIGGGEVLERYARWRRFDVMTLIAVTDGLTRLFSNDVAPLRLVRDAGLAAVNGIAPLKRFFMRHAMGVVGDLPRLMRGQPL